MQCHTLSLERDMRLSLKFMSSICFAREAVDVESEYRMKVKWLPFISLTGFLNFQTTFHRKLCCYFSVINALNVLK